LLSKNSLCVKVVFTSKLDIITAKSYHKRSNKMELILASANKGKLREFEELLGYIR